MIKLQVVTASLSICASYPISSRLNRPLFAPKTARFAWNQVNEHSHFYLTRSFIYLASWNFQIRLGSWVSSCKYRCRVTASHHDSQ
ncbi:hypothetical protein F5Y03DRAFT_347536 [Xylaria venustula]|nr:hypothetical protein F5Y03DRAFT_347536 [Xylaria venustula]